MPYAWQSEFEASAYLLPRWLWLAVEGETGGGALLLHANASSSSSSSSSVSAAEEGRQAMPSPPSDVPVPATFEPFVQIASWGEGEFHPLLSVTSAGLSLEGKHDPASSRGWGGRSNGDAINSSSTSRAIRTREGDLEIAPAADLRLASGTEPGREVRIDAGGINGTISLHSETFHWTSTTTSSAALPSYRNTPREEKGNLEASSRARGQGTAVGEKQNMSGREGEPATSASSSSLRMDADGWEARGSAAVTLTSGRTFDVAVVAQEQEQGEEVHTGTKHEGGSVRGSQNSVNVSAGAVNVEASHQVIVAGANLAILKSNTGSVIIDSNDGNSSLILRSEVLHGAARTVMLRANVGPRVEQRPTNKEALRLENSADVSSDEEGWLEGVLGFGGVGGGRGGEGGYLNLTGEAASLGGPTGKALVEADNEVRLHVNNASNLRVSNASISLGAPTLILGSISATLATPPTAVAPPKKNTPAIAQSTVDETRMRMEGGILAINASENVKFDTPGASVRLVGRCTSSCSHSSNGCGDDSHGGVCRNGRTGGAFAADADEVEIRARSAAGVTIVVDAAEEEAGGGGGGGAERDTGEDRGDEPVGGRLEVSAAGVLVEGASAKIDASRSVVLRVVAAATGQDKISGGGEPTREPRKTSNLKRKARSASTWNNKEDASEGPTVQLNSSGVQVIAAASSESILLRAGSDIVLDTPKFAVSHNDQLDGRGRDSSGSNSKNTGGGGLWSDGLDLTGRAGRRVLLQAGELGGTGKTRTAGGSHVSIEEGAIRVSVGAGVETETPSFGKETAGATAAAAAVSVGATREGGGKNGVVDQQDYLPRAGLSVEVVGAANLSVTEVLKLSAGEIHFSSSNQTLLRSPGGILLAGSPLSGGGYDGVGVGATGSGAARVGLAKQKRQDGHILMAPGVGSGVGIGPVFSSQDLSGPTGIIPSLLYVTNSTRAASERLLPPADAHLTVESLGGAAVGVLSPRGAASALRFGSTGLPYSGGVAVRHHPDGPAGDKFLLELASSPGRVVGDATGRWGVGAVPDTGPVATLHVFATPEVAQASGKGQTSSAVGASEPGAALLVESRGMGGVMQLMGGGIPSSSSSVSSGTLSLGNAIVLTARRADGKTPDVCSHWVVSQLAEQAPLRPAWTDGSADRPSWTGGITFTHVVGRNPTDWRSALGAVITPPAHSNSAAPGGGSDAAVRPTLYLGKTGRSGFGTGSTGARLTVGGTIVAEQVLVFSDGGLVRDLDQLGDQGRQQAIATIRQVEVVSYGWTKEAAASYGLERDSRQLGMIAQQVERASPSLAWEDVSTGRKAVSYSRVLATLVAAFQHLDTSVQAERDKQERRVKELETAATAAIEDSWKMSGRLDMLEGAAEAGLETLRVQERDVAALEGRVVEQGEQADALATAMAAARERAAEERGETQAWRDERIKREQEQERHIRELERTLAETVERGRVELEEREARSKVQDEQIRALSLRLGASQASHSKQESSLHAEMEALRLSQRALDDRLASLTVRADETYNEESYFLAQVRRVEDRLCRELQKENGQGLLPPLSEKEAPTTAATDTTNKNNAPSSVVVAAGVNVTAHLETHKESVRTEAMAAVLRHREHLDAFRAIAGS